MNSDSQQLSFDSRFVTEIGIRSSTVDSYQLRVQLARSLVPPSLTETPIGKPSKKPIEQGSIDRTEDKILREENKYKSNMSETPIRIRDADEERRNVIGQKQHCSPTVRKSSLSAEHQCAAHASCDGGGLGPWPILSKCNICRHCSHDEDTDFQPMICPHTRCSWAREIEVMSDATRKQIEFRIFPKIDFTRDSGSPGSESVQYPYPHQNRVLTCLTR